MAVSAILVGGRARRLTSSLAEMSLAPTPEPVVALVRRLASAGITVTLVEDLQEARAVIDLTVGARGRGMDDSGFGPPSYEPASPPPILLDLEAYRSDDPEDLEEAAAKIAACRAAFPDNGPIAVTAGAPPRLLLECVRAGAFDVIDLTHEGTTTARATVLRAASRQAASRLERELARQARALLDEVVRDLVRTERRTIDLERQLGASDAGLAAGSGDRVYLERIKARHEQLLARYLALSGGKSS